MDAKNIKTFYNRKNGRRFYMSILYSLNISCVITYTCSFVLFEWVSEESLHLNHSGFPNQYFSLLIQFVYVMVRSKLSFTVSVMKCFYIFCIHLIQVIQLLKTKY